MIYYFSDYYIGLFFGHSFRFLYCVQSDTKLYVLLMLCPIWFYLVYIFVITDAPPEQALTISTTLCALT